MFVGVSAFQRADIITVKILSLGIVVSRKLCPLGKSVDMKNFPAYLICVHGEPSSALSGKVHCNADNSQLYYLDVNLYRYYIGREDQSVNEEVMISRIDQQIQVNKIMMDYLVERKLELIKNKRLYQYKNIKGLQVCLLFQPVIAVHHLEIEPCGIVKSCIYCSAMASVLLMHRLDNGRVILCLKYALIAVNCFDMEA